MNECPCYNCICFAMCIGKSLGILTSCKLMDSYLSGTDPYRLHSRLHIVKVIFKKHVDDSFISTVDDCINHAEELMDFNREGRL